MDRGAWQATVQSVAESDTTEQLKHSTSTVVSFPAQCGFGKCLLCGVLVHITTFKHATEKKEKAKL